MKDGCLFCKIANGDAEKLVWQNQFAAAFNDLHPKAPVHVLVVPKQHVETLDQLNDPEALSNLLLAAKTVAKTVGIDGAYRLHINVGTAAGQVVDHLHIHLLGGKNVSDVRADGL